MNTPHTPTPEHGDSHQQQPQYVTFQEVMAAQKITMRDIMDHMTGPVVSLIVHAIAIAFLGSIIIFEPPPEKKEIEVAMTEVEIKEWEQPPEPPPSEEVVTDQEIEIERPDATVADIAVEVDDSPVVDAPQDVIVPNITAIAPSNSALILPGVMALRSGEGRKAALKKYGGSGKTEHAVNKGLRWLRDHQNADGSWGEGKNSKAFLTSIALLAFLAHGETPQSQEYGACVLKAIRRLVDMANNRVRGLVKEDKNTYGHPAVAYALAEAYAMTRIPMIESAMNSMVETLIKGQNPQGGYNYGHNNSDGRFDLSVSGWHYQALKAAFSAGCTVPGIEQAIEKGIKGMKEVMVMPDGSFAYSNGGKEKKQVYGGASMTSVGALCLQLFGEGKSREVHNAIKWLQEKNGGELMKCDWKGIDNYKDTKARDWPLYLWYYQTQAIFQYTDGSGALWNSWNKEFQNALIKEQFPDGHWTSPTQKYSQKAKDKHGENTKTFDNVPIDLDIYSTALCCLMLEVYYRYLPTFKVVSGPVVGTQSSTTGTKTDTSGLIIE